MTSKRILSVGQCCADHANIAQVIGRHFDAEIVPADTAEETFAQLRQETYHLVLINRILDADGSSGLEILKQIKADQALKHHPVMLITNYEEHQHQAVRAGAVPGFGKAALGQPQVVGRLKAILSV